jgi:hypothetical protein
MFFTLSDALFSIALVSMLLKGKLPSNPLGMLLVFWLTALLLIFSGIYASSIIEGQFARGAILSLQYMFCFLVLPFILIRENERRVIQLLLIFIMGVIAVDVHGMITFYTIGYIPESRVVTGGGRLATLFGNANATGVLNGMMIVTVVWLRLSGRISLMLATSFLMVMLWTLVLTSSNTGLIATAAGLAVFLISTCRPKLIVAAAVAVSIGFFFVYFGGLEYFPGAFQKRVLGALESGDITEAGTFVGRAELMKEAFVMLDGRELSLVGIGADQFRVQSAQGAPVHNSFLILWVEGGVFSLVGWCLFSSVGFVIWLYSISQRVETVSSAAVMAVFAAFAVLANAAAHLYARTWYVALLLVIYPTLLEVSRGRRRRS